MSQFAYQINHNFSIIALIDELSVDVDIDCIILDDYRGLAGTITIHKEVGGRGNRSFVPVDYTGEHGWLDFLREYGFAIVPNHPDDRSVVVKLINKKLRRTQ